MNAEQYAAALDAVADRRLGARGADLGAGLVAHLTAAGILSHQRLAHFLAQTCHESGGFSALAENLNYSAASLQAVWPSHFPTPAVAAAYARQPGKIANRAYAGRMGNGDEAGGDGWRFRGRGLIQLTGRANYAATAAATGLDLVAHPELAETSDGAVATACHFWTAHGLNALADSDDVEAITRRINGGLNGLAERRAALARAKAYLGPDRP